MKFFSLASIVRRIFFHGSHPPSRISLPSPLSLGHSLDNVIHKYRALGVFYNQVRGRCATTNVCA